MQIRSFAHKGLRRFYEEDAVKGLPAATLDKLRKMLSFLQDMQAAEDLRAIGVWKAHPLAGGRKSTWSLHVTRNWRLTFRVEKDEIHDVDLEDYH